MRELEFQENVILIDDMNLRLAGESSYNENIENSQTKLEVKIMMKAYGKI